MWSPIVGNRIWGTFATILVKMKDHVTGSRPLSPCFLECCIVCCTSPMQGESGWVPETWSQIADSHVSFILAKMMSVTRTVSVADTNHHLCLAVRCLLEVWETWELLPALVESYQWFNTTGSLVADINHILGLVVRCLLQEWETWALLPAFSGWIISVTSKLAF